jgi:uncharacterized membrane protein
METKKQSKNKLLTIAAIVMAIVAMFGFVDSSYLTAVHLLGETPACSVLDGCEVVTTSEYSTIGPIPIALLGALYYLAIMIGSFLYLDKKKTKVFKLVSLLPLVGFITSLGLVYLMIFVLEAICIYCIGSAISSTILFIVGLYVLYSTSLKRQLDY